jgi:hypothetical protein
MTGRIGADEIEIAGAARIQELIDGYLAEVARTDDGWAVLYRDPGDGRLWELTYPDSAHHGGGAPKLAVVSSDQARARYAF